jgi:opacity protein-like surface antigen
MRTGIVRIAVACAVGAFASSAQAQVGQQNSIVHPDVEVTPFIGIGSAASARIGAAIRFAWMRNLSVELEMDYRNAEVNALGSSVSVLYDLPHLGRVVPYLAAGAGFEQYGTAVQIPGIGLVTRRGLALTVNAGGGVRVPVTDNWGVRTDARWSNGIGPDAPERWRIYNGVTFRRGR